jgi:thiosulfate/3-mercaptopyruvate sulfurtransferase
MQNFTRNNAFLTSALVSLVVLLIATSCIAADLGLIEASALKGNTSRWVILDARPASDWEGGHITGAVHFSWEEFAHTDAKGVKYSSLPPQELAAKLAGLGIDEKSPVVVYGDADKSWGSEAYAAWMLSWLGHKGQVRLLNGGIQSWRSLNLPLVKGLEKPVASKSRYQFELKPQYIITTEDIQKERGAYTLIDTRSTFEWIKGRVPGAIHIPWEDFYSGKEHRLLSPAELKKLLAKHTVDTSKPVVYYCLGGVRSSFAWLSHQLSGLPEAKNYKGSWAAWEKRSGQ